MTVLPEGEEIYTVVSENGSTHRVNEREGRCTCRLLLSNKIELN